MEATENNLEVFEGSRVFNYDGFVQQWIPNYDYFMSIMPRLLGNSPEKSLLAVGCGTGTEILALKEIDKEWSVTGVDPSPEMIDIAQQKLMSYENIELFEGKLEQLMNSSLFGAASLLLVLHFIKYPNEKLELLNEIQKRLKPGAPLILMGIIGDREEVHANLETLEKLLPFNASQKEIDERWDRIKHQLYRTSEEELKKLLIRAGFEKPTRFFQTSIYSGWITKKCSS
ncbi:MAG: class I SAM-dependent methyltransferase [Flavobacteriaceae bacterium]